MCRGRRGLTAAVRAARASVSVGGTFPVDGRLADVPRRPDPIDEVCDALDNDCDGKVDEGLALGEACGMSEGACEPGKLTCSSGRAVCTGEVGPQLETCDCLDNDCDGKTDEGSGSDPVCAGGSVCTMCQCALPCAVAEEFQAVCPQGKARSRREKLLLLRRRTRNDNACFAPRRCRHDENHARRQPTLAMPVQENVCTFV